MDAAAIAAAASLLGIELTAAERAQLPERLETQLADAKRRRGLGFDNAEPPASLFDPRPAGFVPPQWSGPRFDVPDAPPLPESDAEIAFAPLATQAAWIKGQYLTARRLTEIYLERMERLGERLNCFVTPTPELAQAQADAADAEIGAGGWRGPLHGIPYVAKDLLDSAGIATTWGADHLVDRVPERDAAVVARLADAGAVLLGKAALGALAYGDIWHGGQTRNPWNPEEGSGGSSAGSASAVAAGLAAFAIGSETLGSILTPCLRCGATGLRPTYGRVSRRGAMALAWSLDKIGPICRRVVDTGLVLEVLNGADPQDPSTVDLGFEAPAASDAAMRVGYVAADFEAEGARPEDRRVLDTLRSLGHEVVALARPDLPWQSLTAILFAEAAAAFETLTLDDLDDGLRRQDDAAWPNVFRAARFLSAVDHVQADRLRRRAMDWMAESFDRVEAIVSPVLVGPMLAVGNFTGHPALALPTAMIESRRRGQRRFSTGGFALPPEDESGPLHRVPHGVSLLGRLYDEARLIVLGEQLERASALVGERPPMAAE
jgi:Asp-tRNA(Asn)/Glu-tRNA(Gln) amidotransferase A subunit family amidase